MAGAAVCVECWQDLNCLVRQFLTHVSDVNTFEELFQHSVFKRFKDPAEGACSFLVKTTCHVSPTGKSEWKAVQLSDNVALAVAFGCKFVKFDVGCPADIEPAAKQLCVNAIYILLSAVKDTDALLDLREMKQSKDELFNDILQHLKVNITHRFLIQVYSLFTDEMTLTKTLQDNICGTYAYNVYNIQYMYICASDGVFADQCHMLLIVLRMKELVFQHS